MNRLTNKNMEFTFGRMSGKTIFNKIYRKLSQLEDIEEELGIDLITLFEVYNKLCEQKFVYIKIDNEIKCVYYDYYVIDFKNKEIIGMEYEPMSFFSFKDLSKTWALTREELEENDQ